MSAEEVVEETGQLSPEAGSSEITGGEPMLQRESRPAYAAAVEGYTVLLETNGERPLANVPKGVVKIVDVKCPNSAEPDTFHMENLEALASQDEVKFVLAGRSDYEFARDFAIRHSVGKRNLRKLFSPVFSKDSRGARDAIVCSIRRGTG